MSYFDVKHLQSCALFEVSDEGRTVLRFDVLNLLIEDDLGRGTFAYLPSLESECHEKNDHVSKEQQVPRKTVRFETEGVDDRDSDDEEHIIHLADRHRLRAVAYHAEDGEQAQHEARLDVEDLHQP